MTHSATTATLFAIDTKNHRMEIAHDHGLYRHLRFRAHTEDGHPTSIGWFDLITAPGTLTFVGDYEAVTFRRLDDMFQFFRSSHHYEGPNLGYWAEKVANGGAKAVTAYSEEQFEKEVKQTVAEDIRSRTAPRGIGRAIREQIFDAFEYDLTFEDQARAALDNFEYEGYRFHDTWEWSFDDYTHAFQWACHAIVYGIREYDRVKAETAAHQADRKTLGREASSRQQLVHEYRGGWVINPATAPKMPVDRCPLCGTTTADLDEWANHMADHGTEAFSWLKRWQETHPAAA